MRKLLSILFIIFCHISLVGQNLHGHTPQLNYQDSLVSLGKAMINDTVDTERKSANYAFIKTLVNALKQPHSYNINFDSVKSISLTNSPDNKFRIFSWHVLNDDGSYRFYGTIQINSPDGKLQLFPLVDYSPFIKDPQDTLLTNTQWYGAQYYTIIPVAAPHPYYILLGWKGNNIKTTKKVIDVLSFTDGKPLFGAPVFVNKTKTDDRIVFEYTRQVSMMLKYLPGQNTIIFDHLAPLDNRMEGRFEQYGPDLTYDAYKLTDGKWQFKDNVDLRNGAAVGDDMTDPRKEAKQDRAAAGRPRQ